MSSFANEYIDKCIEIGISTPIAICELAKQEISSLDEEIKKIEGIRSKQTELRAVIKQLGGVEVIKRAKKSPMIIDPMITEKDLDPYVKEICVKICNFVELKDPVKLTPREIMDAVASIEENRIVLTGIKWLWDQGIIERSEGSLIREIGKGSKWDKRPQK